MKWVIIYDTRTKHTQFTFRRHEIRKQGVWHTIYERYKIFFVGLSFLSAGL